MLDVVEPNPIWPLKPIVLPNPIIVPPANVSVLIVYFILWFLILNESIKKLPTDEVTEFVEKFVMFAFLFSASNSANLSAILLSNVPTVISDVPDNTFCISKTM